jgi:acyl carrier protein
VNAEVSEALQAIDAAGGEAIVAAADAADEAAMSAAIASARTRWGRINGVIHAAGVSGSGSLASLQTIDEARATFRAKVTGLEVLIRLLGQVPLDFVALMSSINSVLGAAGTCDYAAANAVLDAFASSTAKPAAWRQVVSINWGAWRDVGMAANLVVPEARRAQWRAMLATAIPPDVGVEAFARVLASRRARVVVASYDVLEVIRAKAATSAAAGASASPPDSQEPAPLSEAQTRPDLSTAFDAPGTDLEKRLAAIWSELLGVQPIGRQDDFFELGGHSLLATRVLARVHESFGVRLELRDVFDAPTVGRMAERIDRGAAVALVESEEREEIEF